MKKLVLPENKSVNDLSVIGGINGDDAIEPGAPPTCFGACCPGTAAATGAAGACIFDDDDNPLPLLRILRVFFDMIKQ